MKHSVEAELLPCAPSHHIVPSIGEVKPRAQQDRSKWNLVYTQPPGGTAVDRVSIIPPSDPNREDIIRVSHSDVKMVHFQWSNIGTHSTL